MTYRQNLSIEAAIDLLIEQKTEIKIQDIAELTGLSKTNESDRKAIRRALNVLVKRGALSPSGNSRNRVYLVMKTMTDLTVSDSIKSPLTVIAITGEFAGIPLTAASIRLLDQISLPTNTRRPVGYNQDFLRSYRPNETFYLMPEDRLKLMEIGKAENAPRPAGTYARKIFDRLLIELSWNSSRLEGNTYSLLETKLLIEKGESAAGKDVEEAQMILNHKGAIEYILETSDEIPTTANEICSIHALLSDNLLGDPRASGRLREVAVKISGSTYIPLESPQFLKECFDLFIEKLNEIKDPFEQSFFSLVHLSYLQVFEDVNKRTARLVANIPLIKKNLRPLSFTDVESSVFVKALLAVYEENDSRVMQDLYLWAYERSALKYSALQQSLGEPNALKLRYREEIATIVRKIVQGKFTGREISIKLSAEVDALNLLHDVANAIYKMLEIEIISLHEGNIARFKIRPAEFLLWKKLQE